MSTTRIVRPLAALLACGAIALVAAAGAASEPAPTACPEGLRIGDPKGDQVAPDGFAAAATDSTDALELFSRFDSGKATINFHVKSLKLEVPSGFTSVAWQAIYFDPDGTQKFVRAVLDFSGSLAFEFGDFVDVGGATSTSSYAGDTTGKAYEGADGVISIVVPADRGGAAGNKLTKVYGETRVGRTVPNAAHTPSRGLSNTLDSVPDDGVDKGGTITQTPCSTAGTTGPTGPTGPSETPTPGSGTGPGSGSGAPTSERPLPVKVVAGKLRATKIKRKLKLKLRSTEKVTSLGARLRKGTKVVGTGKLAQVNGKATLKLKVKKLKKGTYVLDLVGTDAAGARRFVSYKLKVRK
jgi:hypothetical protein